VLLKESVFSSSASKPTAVLLLPKPLEEVIIRERVATHGGVLDSEKVSPSASAPTAGDAIDLVKKSAPAPTAVFTAPSNVKSHRKMPTAVFLLAKPSVSMSLLKSTDHHASVTKAELILE